MDLPLIKNIIWSLLRPFVILAIYGWWTLAWVWDKYWNWDPPPPRIHYKRTNRGYTPWPVVPLKPIVKDVSHVKWVEVAEGTKFEAMGGSK